MEFHTDVENTQISIIEEKFETNMPKLFKEISYLAKNSDQIKIEPDKESYID